MEAMISARRRSSRCWMTVIVAVLSRATLLPTSPPRPLLAVSDVLLLVAWFLGAGRGGRRGVRDLVGGLAELAHGPSEGAAQLRQLAGAKDDEDDDQQDDQERGVEAERHGGAPPCWLDSGLWAQNPCPEHGLRSRGGPSRPSACSPRP